MNYKKIEAALAINPIVPVLTVKDASNAVLQAGKLVEQGYQVLEVVLRTPAALDAIGKIKAAFPDTLTGAGSIINRTHIKESVNAGADFLVTPATSADLIPALLKAPVPVYPGCATATEAQTLFEAGFPVLKFFPAEANGGIAALKSLAAPLPHLKFMPTGGIKKETAPNYLSLPNVIAVGGSWMVA